MLVACALAACSCAAAANASAAAIGVAVSGGTVAHGQALEASVSLDTQGASANAVQGEITFPESLFRFGKVIDGGSAVSLWVDPPQESASGTVDFAGIMPGGFSGADGALFSFTLLPIAPGTGTIQVATATVLANDGLGSPLSVVLASASVSVAPANPTLSPSPSSAQTPDYTAPNPFTPEVVRDPGIFGGKYFLVFSTTDSGSGIDHFEVLEVPSGGSEQPLSSWQVATSPYLLTDQSLSSDIYVRAVDHDGNFIVVKVPAEHPQEGRNDEWIVAIVALAALVVSWLIWIRRRARA